jgi:hypothetical protein
LNGVVMKADLQKREAALASSPPPQNLKFEREDWTLFRTIEGLQQRAGVPKERLRRLVLKELADNGLDLGTNVSVGEIEGGYFIEDDGPGLKPDEVARLFSIKRPMVSTKLLRLPTRGALGNGLRVVAGAVLASEGKLTVITRNRRIDLRPERDGTTTIVNNTTADHPTGTRIEIKFGLGLPEDADATFWARIAIRLARGESYSGKSSAYWYDHAQFHELLYSSGNTLVRELVGSLDGCSGAKAGTIVNAAGLGREICGNLSREQSDRLLGIAQGAAKVVKPGRLGFVGPGALPGEYGVARGSVGQIPYVIEAWAVRSGQITLVGCVNRTPITGSLHAARDKRDIDAFGCGLSYTIAAAPKEENFHIWLNVITPYMPITSDGKAPNLRPFLDGIRSAVGTAVRKAKRPGAVRISQKDVILDNLDEAIAKVSDAGRYRFNQRQLLYVLRPIIREELNKELSAENFGSIITNYESEHGEIPGMYREPRGSIYHPHRRQTITLGTLMVEDYQRPEWAFNKLLYIEKEGFSEALKDVGWPERHDCAVMSSKGFSTRAARDLIDKLAEHDEPVTVFCVHDADAYGTMIYQTLQSETKARNARKIEIVNLGLEPEEALAMDLEVEEVDEKDRRRPVADYALDREEWLQTKRVELNAMTTAQFIEWLDGKMADYDKLIPPPSMLLAELTMELETRVRVEVTEKILREAGIEEQVAATLAAIDKPDADEMERGVRAMFEREPGQEWRAYIKGLVRTTHLWQIR